MQNSGLGNIVNPVTSLLDPKVYSIPVMFLIGWRGEPGINDEPQHIKQGEITIDMLETLGIRYAILPRTMEALQPLLAEAMAYMKWNRAPFALVVSKNAFKAYSTEEENAGDKNSDCQKKVYSKALSYPLTREEVLKILIDQTDPGDIVVSTTGKTSREIFEYRESTGLSSADATDKEINKNNNKAEGFSPEELNALHSRDFLTVGSMGHASQIALGIALAKPQRNVYCIDGDGAVIMHMGGLAIIGEAAPSNLIHIVINNGAHESVGGQPTAGFNMDITAVASACGYKSAMRAEDEKELRDSLREINKRVNEDKDVSSGYSGNQSGVERVESGGEDLIRSGPVMLEVRVKKGSRKDLGRPTTTPVENKKVFMQFLQNDANDY